MLLESGLLIYCIYFGMQRKKMHFAFKEHSATFFHSFLFSILSSSPQLEVLGQARDLAQAVQLRAG